MTMWLAKNSDAMTAEDCDIYKFRSCLTFNEATREQTSRQRRELSTDTAEDRQADEGRIKDP